MATPAPRAGPVWPDLSGNYRFSSGNRPEFDKKFVALSDRLRVTRDQAGNHAKRCV